MHKLNSRDLTIISFDIGIKNLAYCVFSINNKSDDKNNKTSILKWGVANLIPTDANAANTSHTCNCKKRLKMPLHFVVKKPLSNMNKIIIVMSMQKLVENSCPPISLSPQ
jgi:hypothetical protein